MKTEIEKAIVKVRSKLKKTTDASEKFRLREELKKLKQMYREEKEKKSA